MAPSEPTSCYFVALLGCLDAATVARLERWAAESCVEHALSEQKDGSLALYAVKSSAKTARAYQSLLRTLASHWKLPFGKLDRGWLKLLSAGEYRARSAAQQEAEPPVVPARVETHGLPCRAELRALTPDEFREKVLADKAKSVPARSVAELERAEITYLTSLGPDFAERSRALLIALRAKKAAC